MRAIGVGTFLGGPLAAGGFAAINFHRLGRKREGRVALVAGVVVSVVLFGALLLLPSEISDRIPNVALPAIYIPIALLLIQRTQGAQIEALFAAESARKANGWATAGLGLAALALTLGAIFPFAMMLPPFDFGGERVRFGPDGMHTVYVRGEIAPSTVETLFNTLDEEGWVPEDFGGSFQIERTEEGYELTIPILRQWWTDIDFLAEVAALRAQLIQTTFRLPLTIILIDEDLKRTYRKRV
jgi:hypothetical protein